MSLYTDLLYRCEHRDRIDFASGALDFLKAQLTAIGRGDLADLAESIIELTNMESSDPHKWMGYESDLQKVQSKVQWKMLKLMPSLSQDEYHIALN